ncbi:cupin domain-containing protein [Nakamurella flavida]|uniref:Cupin domain-containing protein n=1 Tax=Nakamurella flavida TaxID=363630 RepID=A0A939C0Y8_9ACTN|nr:cupin domain-containing protein [Nakamurella flavida]MBM9477193.1 cupin domain-containing protein [Nakamurella flavida]MDP9780142.1 putative cupin superfamily sugar epimerase [Nakamurella flavida]
MTVEQIIAALALEPLPVEGGLFAVTHADEHGSAIHFLVRAPDFSALHLLTAAETYHHYAGAPLRLVLLHPDGTVTRPVLGTDLAAGQRPQIRVPGGVWQGSASAGEWTLVGTTMAPPYDPDGVRFAGQSELTARWPAAADDIAALTRS